MQLPYFIRTLTVSTCAKARLPTRGTQVRPCPLSRTPLRDNSNVAGCYEDPTADRSLSCIYKLQSLSFGAKNGHGPIAVSFFQSKYAARFSFTNEQSPGRHTHDQWCHPGQSKQWTE